MFKVLEYLKYLGLFLLFVLGIAIITSLISLTNLSSVFISKLSVILTAISFFLVAFMASKKMEEKGYLLGLKLALFSVLFLILINFIFFHSKISIDRFIYYIILIASGILGGSFGKNFKKKEKK